MIDQLIKDADTNPDIDLSDDNLRILNNDLKLKETTSVGKTFLDMLNTQDDVPLKEDDSPSDFASGINAAVTANSGVDMSGGDTSNSTTSSTTSTANTTSDYSADTGSSGLGTAPSYGDININPGNGDYEPDMPDQNMPPVDPNAPEYKIIDVLVDENDPSKVKVKVKDTKTGKIETKDLNEIDA